MTTTQPAALPELLREIVAYCREAGHDWSSLAEAEHHLAALQSQPAAAGVSDAEADDDFADKFDGWIETIKAAHDESLEDLHKSSRAVLRDLIDEMEASRAILALRPQSEPVGEAGTMPGTSGFTMACFHADKVPVGTKLYAEALRPQAVPMTDSERADMICAVAAICTGTSSRNLAATAIEWTERRYGITAQGAQGGQA